MDLSSCLSRSIQTDDEGDECNYLLILNFGIGDGRKGDPESWFTRNMKGYVYKKEEFRWCLGLFVKGASRRAFWVRTDVVHMMDGWMSG